MNKENEEKGSFKILFYYLKNDKFKLFLFIVFSILTYAPDIFCALLVGKALEALLYKSMSKFLLYIILYDGIYLFAYTIAQSARDYIYNSLEIKFIRSVMKDMYEKYQNLPAIAFEEIGVGEYISRLENDTDRVMQILARLTKLICKSLNAIAVIIISFYVSIYVGLELLIFALIMWLMSKKFFPVIKKTHKVVKTEHDALIRTVTENITGIREVKSLGIKNTLKEDINKKIDTICIKNLKIRNYETAYYAFNSAIYFLLQFCILLTCGYLFIKGQIVYSVFMMIQMFLNRLDSVVESLSGFGVDYNKVKVSLARIKQIINSELYEEEKFGNVTLDSPKGEIIFKKVSFRYRDNENDVLNNLSITFTPGKKIAIVGKSGNGKSTIFNLLSRYFDATKGVILIDGNDIKSLTEDSLRSTISVIRQSPFIFNRSIIDNFRLVKPNVTLKEVRSVCQKAYLDEYIMSLPKKYKTIIGEGGINLSGGQKQRMAIARTLLLNTKIILFDEATSALDNESQHYIKKTIDALKSDHTIIVIAHRLSTIIDADEIYLLEKGKLKAKGTHEALLANSSIYRKLYLKESSDNSDKN